jgi:hypothetical protein
MGRFSLASVRDSKRAERAAKAEPATVVPDAFTSEPVASSSARKTPMAVLTRIAGRSKPGQHSPDAAASRPEQIKSGAGRR